MSSADSARDTARLAAFPAAAEPANPTTAQPFGGEPGPESVACGGVEYVADPRMRQGDGLYVPDLGRLYEERRLEIARALARGLR